MSGLQQGLLHDELTTYTHDKWVQRKLYASLVMLSWTMGLFYYVSLPVVSAPAEVVLKGHSCCKGSGAVQMPLVAQSIRTQQSNQRHCPEGNSGPRGKVIKRQKKTFLPFRCETPRVFTALRHFKSSQWTSPFPSLQAAFHHEYEICLRWMTVYMNIECSMPVISSHVITFFRTHKLISVEVCS